MRVIPIMVALVAMCALLQATDAYPFEEEYDEDEEQTVPILKPGPYESSESAESAEDQANEFDLPVNEASGQDDSEELQNDSGFHHEQGDRRPDGGRMKLRQRRSPQESDEYDDGSWQDTDSDEYETADEGEYENGYNDDEDYELSDYSSEEDQYEYEDGAIDNGEFDNEEEVGQDEDGVLLRLMHNTA